MVTVYLRRTWVMAAGYGGCVCGLYMNS